MESTRITKAKMENFGLIASTKNKEVSKDIKDAVKNKRLADDLVDFSNKKRGVLTNMTNSPLKTQQSSKKIKREVDDTKDKAGKVAADLDEKENGFFNVLRNSPEDDKTETRFVKVILKEEEMEEDDLPPGVEDFDKANINDISNQSRYAKHIFNYYRRREGKFIIEKYLDRQPEISSNMRAVLVDWLVEVQENFELNHETLYLSVKLIDLYLMKNAISKNDLQLVGVAAILVASKYDERMPPLVDDFLYICDGCYTRRELLSMEVKILTCMKFDIGLPLSYRFLRRYARCAKLGMDTLTLARYILEMSLLEYDLITVQDSKLAASALLLALKMKNIGCWTPTLQYYSGYQESELLGLMKTLNGVIAAPLNKNLMTIRVKYSHKIFFEVVKVPPLQLED